MSAGRDLSPDIVSAIEGFVARAKERGDAQAVGLFEFERDARVALAGALFMRARMLDAPQLVDFTDRLHRAAWDCGAPPAVVVLAAGFGGGWPVERRTDMHALLGAVVAHDLRWVAVLNTCQIARGHATFSRIARELVRYDCGLLDLGSGQVLAEELLGALDRLSHMQQMELGRARSARNWPADEELGMWRDIVGGTRTTPATANGSGE